MSERDPEGTKLRQRGRRRERRWEHRHTGRLGQGSATRINRINPSPPPRRRRRVAATGAPAGIEGVIEGAEKGAEGGAPGSSEAAMATAPPSASAPQKRRAVSSTTVPPVENPAALGYPASGQSRGFQRVVGRRR
eukprot:3615632-Pyramimonas_sp.AAC.1